MTTQHMFIAFPSLSGEPFHFALLCEVIKAIDPVHLTVWYPRTNYVSADMRTYLRGIVKDAEYIGGFILPTASDERDQEPLSKTLKRFKVPIVLIDTLPEGLLDEEGCLPPGIAYVGYDNKDGARLAAEEMISRLMEFGREAGQVLVLHAREQCERHEHFVELMGATLPDIKCRLMECGWSRKVAIEMVRHEVDEIDLKEEIVGIFACNDEMAIGAMIAISEIDPDALSDIIVVGYDASGGAEALINTTTYFDVSVEQPPYHIAAEAKELLLEMIDEREDLGENVRRQPSLIRGKHKVISNDKTHIGAVFNVLFVAAAPRECDAAMLQERQQIYESIRRRFGPRPHIPIARSINEVRRAISEYNFHAIHIATREKMSSDRVFFADGRPLTLQDLDEAITFEARDRRLSHVVITGYDVSAFGNAIVPHVDIAFMYIDREAGDMVAPEDLDHESKLQVEDEILDWVKNFYGSLRTSYRIDERDFELFNDVSEAVHLKVKLRRRRQKSRL